MEALATLRILPRRGRIAWVSRFRACFAEPPAESPSTRKISVPSADARLQSVSLPGSRTRRVGVFRANARSCFRLSRSSARSTTYSRSALALAGSPVRKWSKWSLTAVSSQPRDGRGGQPILGLALEYRIADEHRQQPAGRAEDVFAGDLGGAFVADELAIGLQPAHQTRHEGRCRAFRLAGSGPCCNRTGTGADRPPARRSPIPRVRRR